MRSIDQFTIKFLLRLNLSFSQAQSTRLDCRDQNFLTYKYIKYGSHKNILTNR